MHEKNLKIITVIVNACVTSLKHCRWTALSKNSRMLWDLWLRNDSLQNTTGPSFKVRERNIEVSIYNPEANVYLNARHSQQATVRHLCILQTAEPALGGRRERPLTRPTPPVFSAWPSVPPPAETVFAVKLRPLCVRDLRGVIESHHISRDLFQVLIGRLHCVGVYVQYDHVLQSSTLDSLSHPNTEGTVMWMFMQHKLREKTMRWERIVVPPPGWSGLQWGTALAR